MKAGARLRSSEAARRVGLEGGFLGDVAVEDDVDGDFGLYAAGRGVVEGDFLGVGVGEG